MEEVGRIKVWMKNHKKWVNGGVTGVILDIFGIE